MIFQSTAVRLQVNANPRISNHICLLKFNVSYLLVKAFHFKAKPAKQSSHKHTLNIYVWHNVQISKLLTPLQMCGYNGSENVRCFDFTTNWSCEIYFSPRLISLQIPTYLFQVEKIWRYWLSIVVCERFLPEHTICDLPNNPFRVQRKCIRLFLIGDRSKIRIENLKYVSKYSNVA